MPVDPELIELMQDTVQWQPRTSVGGSGFVDQQGFGPAVAVRCYIEPMRQEIRVSDTNTRVADAVFYTDHVYGIKPEDKVTLPNGDTHPILTVHTFTDDVGPSHEKVHI